MADNFTPITLNTQEDVDHFMADRLLRARRAGADEKAKEFADYDDFKAKAEKYDTDIAALKETITGLEGEKNNSAAKISELETKIREYETASVKTRIARETGIPAELAERLTGDTEQALREDAEKLRGLMKPQPAPMYRPSGENGSDGRDAALKDLLKRVRNDN